LFSLQNLKDFWNRLLKIVGKKDLFFSASAITFNLFICSIPFVLIMISIVGYVLSYDEALEMIIQYGSNFLPSFSFQAETSDVIQGSQTIENLLNPLIGAREVFGVIGLIILLFFTQGLLHAIKHVLFDIFDIEERKHPLMQVVYNFFWFGLLGALVYVLALVINLSSAIDLNDFSVPYTDITLEFSWVYELLNFLVPIIFTFIVIYIVFRYLSERRIQRDIAVVGAFAYTLLFEIARLIISGYLEYAFSSYRYFYQGYAILIVIGIWVFYSAFLFVLSATIAKAYYDTYKSHKPTVLDNPYADLD
jgi:YihY family inner membrane protein